MHTLKEILKQFNIFQFLKDGNNHWSMMRLICAVCLMWVSDIIYVWHTISFETKSVQAFPDITVFGTILTLVIGKAAQKFAERN